jgi:hypothetical protein
MLNLLKVPAVLVMLGAGLLTAERESLEQQFEAAEQPLIDYRANYLKALLKAKEQAQKAGNVEKVSRCENDIKEFTDGVFPDGVGVNAKLEKVFVMRYGGVLEVTSKRLRSIAAKTEGDRANAKVGERLEFWKKPLDEISGSDVLITYLWNISMDPRLSLSSEADPARRLRTPLKEVFSANGIAFPEGASVTYSPDQHVLVVTQTWKEIFKLEQLLRHNKLIK